MKKYTASQIAKFLAAGVTSASTVAVAFAQALKDGVITADEWSVLIPIISGAIITTVSVFVVPNGLEGDTKEDESDGTGTDTGNTSRL